MPARCEDETDDAPLLIREARAALAASEARFRALVENTSDAIALLDPQGNVTYVSPAITTMLGHRPAHLIAKPGFAFLHPVDRKRMRKLFARSIREGAVRLRDEVRARHTDGSWRDLELSIVSRLEDPSVDAIVVTLRDVTDRKQSESTLRRLAAIVESSDDAIVGKTLDGVITSWNRGAEGTYGYTAEEAIGRSITMLAPPGQAAEVLGILRRVGRGEAIPPFETVRVRKDGSRIDVSLTVSPVRDHAGRIAGASVIARDVTRRKQADAALRQSEERYRALMEQANDAIMLFAPGRTILEANRRAEQMFGCSRADLVGMSYDDLVVEEEREASTNARASLLEEGTVAVANRHLRRPDGTVIPVDISAAVVHVGDEPLLLGILRDVTERRQTEEALRRNAAGLKAVLDAALDAVIGMDSGGHVVSWNPRAEAIFGWTAEEATGRLVADLIVPPDQRRAHAQGIQRFLASGQKKIVGRRVEMSAVGKDGTIFPVELSVVAVEEQGDTRFTAFIADITERRAAQSALDQLRRRNELILNSIADGVHGVGKDGRITFENPAAARMLGRSIGELLGRPAHETMHHTGPDGTATALSRCPIHATLADGEERQVVDDVFWRGDGTSFPVEFRVAPMIEADGGITGAVVTFRDVTERREAALRLAESEQQYRLLFDANHQPMWVMDEETRAFLAVNDAAVARYGWSRQEFEAMSLPDIHPQDLVQPLLEALAGSEKKETPIDYGSVGGWRHRTKDGTVIDVEGGANPIRFRGRRAWLAHATDVTERRKLEAQLHQSQKIESVGRLAAGIAHDFNNMLSVIRGYGEMMGRKMPGETPLRRYVDGILKAADGAGALTRQLLAFSRQQVMQLGIHDVNVVVADIETMLRRLIGEDIELSTVLGADLAPIRVDAGQMQQVVMNLVVNARDAMPRGGRLVVETSTALLDESYTALHPEATPGQYTVIAVSDSGHGIPPELRARIFDPFFTTKAPGTGTGLGLATVHGIVKQSGGHIFVYSEVGRGTTFKVYLPAAPGLAPPSPRALAAAPALPVGSGTVLLVEDHPSLRTIIQEMLEEGGYTVWSAEDATTARALVEQTGTIDLLLTDVVMPGTGGRELANELTARRPEMKVLYMSGYTDDAIVRHGVLTQEMPFLEKPFTAVSLLAKARAVLRPASEPPREE
jgi:two-component system cell cycle sensor histidine kinase/response regulator CckA